MRAGIRSLALTLAAAGAASADAQQQRPAPRPPKTINVPADYRSVQQAIDSARRGDTVLVAPGRYFENISFRGKDIVLTSHFALGGDTSFISRTVLDGSRAANPDTASVVIMDHELDSTAVLQGFTITGGTGTVWLDPKDKVYFREGGGVLCEFGSPVIRYNVIENNEASDTTPAKGGTKVVSAGGGGIRCGFAEPTIENNVIRGNRGRYGAGVVLFHTSATVRNNLVVGNTGGEDFGGSGLWVVGPYSRRVPNVIEHNTVVRNVSASADTNPRAMRGKAGGMIYANSVSVVRNNIVWGNSQAMGGQVGFPPGMQPTMTHNLVQGGGVAGAGNIDADPLFADTISYRLSPRSPAVDAGDPRSPSDPANGTRKAAAAAPALGAVRADLGAYGGARASGPGTRRSARN
ncbi:MAG TPA: right-handed parallel beta-helix repeat-containing protein [Gemmatimonadaceae bacterium]|nr:right-handed parallel beta-helix repeat-containing protein [Gemmatimonadaceae bacterium]